MILETGELGTYDNVRRASLLAMAAGADFIKTSTGKVTPAATLPVTLCMLEAIRDVHEETGRVVGMKPAGGIRTAKQAIQYLVVLHETLGLQWMTPDLFRFGASSLLNDVLMQIRKQKTGRYQSADYFTSTDERARQATRTGAGPDRVGLRARARGARDRPAREALRALHRRQVRQAALGRVVPVRLAVERGEARRGGAGERAGRQPRGQGRARGVTDGWSKLAASERAKYLFRIARLLQERSRELAVLESLDGGKPIRESRDVDLPLAAAHFFYYAGWADKLEYAFPAGSRSRSASPARSSPGTSRC